MNSDERNRHTCTIYYESQHSVANIREYIRLAYYERCYLRRYRNCIRSDGKSKTVWVGHGEVEIQVLGKLDWRTFIYTWKSFSSSRFLYCGLQVTICQGTLHETSSKLDRCFSGLAKTGPDSVSLKIRLSESGCALHIYIFTSPQKRTRALKQRCQDLSECTKHAVRPGLPLLNGYAAHCSNRHSISFIINLAALYKCRWSQHLLKLSDRLKDILTEILRPPDSSS